MSEEVKKYELYAFSNKVTTLILLCFMFLMFGLSIIFWTQLGNRQIGYTNQTYQKINSCIISVAPTVRTPEYVKSCYDLAEKETGIIIERYGDGK